MLITVAQKIPIWAFVASAQTAEVSTIETLVDGQITGKRPKRLLHDEVAYADGLRDALQRRGIEQITPHLKGRKNGWAYPGEISFFCCISLHGIRIKEDRFSVTAAPISKT